MIFIGGELSDPRAHFVTNVVNSIGSGDDLLIDLDVTKNWPSISSLIKRHLARVGEQYVIYNATTDEQVPLRLRREFPHLVLITFFSDDEWRHANYDRYLALFSDVFTIAVKNNLAKYAAYGLSNVHYMRWGCNPELFYPVDVPEQIYDVTFIGAAYGNRIDHVLYLLRAGVKLTVFGRGWERHPELKHIWGGILSQTDMIRVISQSKINLNFLWTSRDGGIATIKGRTLELAACKAFQLSNPTNEFINYGFVPGTNVAVFDNKEDLLGKIQHYLAHSNERHAIASAGYEHVLDQLTWRAEFNRLFTRLTSGEVAKPQLPRFKILVILAEGVHHAIEPEDPRLEIAFTKESKPSNASSYDGVIVLDQDSTINNDALYMMVFGLHADKADCILANFYLGKHWIRFKDHDLLNHPNLARYLPLGCRITSGKSWNNEARPSRNPKKTFIEYPTFAIKLGYARARLLRLIFCDHGNSRKKVKTLLSQGKLQDACSVILDRGCQELLLKLS